MNVIRLRGGLGNQLFQYAFGQTMENVAYDISWYKKGNREYLLDKFNLDVKISDAINKEEVREEGFDLGVINKRDCNISGYWQSPLFFETQKEILKENIQVKETFYTEEFIDLKEEISNVNSVGVHVRRGDFLQSNAHVVMPLKYYRSAIEIMESLIEDPIFYMFSDDINWCKANFKGVNFFHLKGYLDFELLKTCKHKIIPNSTFGWWSAYLNGETVICPQKWYKKNQELSVVRRQLLPKDWIKLNV